MAKDWIWKYLLRKCQNNEKSIWYISYFEKREQNLKQNDNPLIPGGVDPLYNDSYSNGNKLNDWLIDWLVMLCSENCH